MLLAPGRQITELEVRGAPHIIHGWMNTWMDEEFCGSPAVARRSRSQDRTAYRAPAFLFARGDN